MCGSGVSALVRRDSAGICLASDCLGNIVSFSRYGTLKDCLLSKPCLGGSCAGVVDERGPLVRRVGLGGLSVVRSFMAGCGGKRLNVRRPACFRSLLVACGDLSASRLVAAAALFGGVVHETVRVDSIGMCTVLGGLNLGRGKGISEYSSAGVALSGVMESGVLSIVDSGAPDAGGPGGSSYGPSRPVGAAVLYGLLDSVDRPPA